MILNYSGVSFDREQLIIKTMCNYKNFDFKKKLDKNLFKENSLIYKDFFKCLKFRFRYECF